MPGMNQDTGKAIDGLAYLRQRTADALLTPLGSRVAQRDYGSSLFDLTDAPLTPLTAMRIKAEAIRVVGAWVPDLDARRVELETADDVLTSGGVAITLHGFYRPTGAAVTLDRIEVAR